MADAMKLGIVRVLTRHDSEWLNNAGRIVEALFPDVETVSRCIDDQPFGIFDDATLKAAEPKIVRLAGEMEREGVDGIFVNCAADPAVDLVRRTCGVPIVGAGSAAALMALAYGKPVGLLGLEQVSAPAVMRTVLGDRLVGSTHPQGVVTALDLHKPGAQEAFVAAAEDLRGRGARVIALACTGFTIVEAAPMLSRRTGIPVVDPVVAGATIIRFMMLGRRGEQ